MQVPNGTYLVYALDGQVMATGLLSEAMTLSAPMFDVVFTMSLTSVAMSGPPNEWLEFGLIVNQERGAADPAVCIEISDTEYVTYEEHKETQPFFVFCIDEGNGTFVPGEHLIVPSVIPSPSCAVPPASCDLNWFYSPLDRGCHGYNMSVLQVEVDVGDAAGFNPGDGMTLHVNGTTQMRSIPADATYNITDLWGSQVAPGLLSTVMTLYNCGTEGCYFGLQTSFTAGSGCFGSNWFAFGLRVSHAGGEGGWGSVRGATRRYPVPRSLPFWRSALDAGRE